MRSTLVKKHGTANIGRTSKLKKPDPLSLTASQASFTFTFSYWYTFTFTLLLAYFYFQSCEAKFDSHPHKPGSH